MLGFKRTVVDYLIQDKSLKKTSHDNKNMTQIK